MKVWRALGMLVRQLGMLAVAASIAGLLFAWSGLYDVAASSGHWRIVDWFLEFGLRSSVRTQSLSAPSPPALDDAGLVRRGAAHFASGCAPCHGSPQRPPNPIAAGMLPQPPSLSVAAPTWRRRELFYIVKHGLKFTGMPAWSALERDDEVWAMVAFLERLANMQPDEYRSLAFGPLVPDGNVNDLLLRGHTVGAASACARCHGLEGQGFNDEAFPKLAGQSEAFLLQALEAYASGRRASGIMQPAVANLEPGVLRELARYYSRQKPMTSLRRTMPTGATLARGQEIATNGIPQLKIPSCAPCHGPTNRTRNPLYPSLAGQYASYLESQLALWRRGQHRQSPLAQVMAPIGAALSSEDAKAVAAYYATLSTGDPSP